MDPSASVRQGQWVEGPDGERELDVLIEGTADGQPRAVLIECKDYDRARVGRVGVSHVDALESKRRDLGVDVAVLCSNAGFSETAIRKAGRVRIDLIGVMRSGDRRVRFQIPEALYTRRIQLKSMNIELRRNGTPYNLSGVGFDDVLFEGQPLGNWIRQRVAMVLGVNPIVSGRYTDTCHLTEPISFDTPDGPVEADVIVGRFEIEGGWYVQDVALDADAGLYDWLRRRVRLAPGPNQFQIHNVNLDAGSPIDRPPDHALELDIQKGEMMMRLLAIDGLGEPTNAPDVARFVVKEDLSYEVKDLPDEASTSSARNAS
jgi:hypothetical protein